MLSVRVVNMSLGSVIIMRMGDVTKSMENKEAIVAGKVPVLFTGNGRKPTQGIMKLIREILSSCYEGKGKTCVLAWESDRLPVALH